MSLKLSLATGQKIFFVSDTHFGHRAMSDHFRVGKYPYVLGERKDAMDWALIAQWNGHVTPYATVFHLGDVAFRNAQELRSILDKLNGKVYLVPGNHDKQQIKVVEQYGWEILPPLCELKVDEQYIVLCHYALRSWNRMHYGAWQLHGHSHGNLESRGKQLDVGVDCEIISPDLRPISYAEVETYMAAQTFYAVDHHTPKEYA